MLTSSKLQGLWFSSLLFYARQNIMIYLRFYYLTLYSEQRVKFPLDLWTKIAIQPLLATYYKIGLKNDKLSSCYVMNKFVLVIVYIGLGRVHNSLVKI